jgi:type I restriction enzyme, S subunit
MEKQVNIPKLRFPEFEGEWEKKKLGEVAEFKAGYAFNSEEMLTEKSNFQLLKMSNVYQSELRLDRNPSFWENITEKQKEFLLKKGDSILTLTGTVGKRDYGYSVLIQEDNKFLLNQRLVLLREIKGKSASGFIKYILSNEIFLFYFFGESKGGTGNQTNVSTEDVKNIRLKFPSLLEQEKIASFLTAVDDKLQTLKKKKSLLEQYKKGVIQKIFSQELRFKADDGSEYPEWEDKKFSSYIKLYRGSSPRPINKYITKSENGVNWIKIGDMKSVEKNLINQVSEKITDEGALHSRKVEIGELILANSMSFGKTYQLNISGCIYDGWFVLREYEVYFNKEFLLQLLNSEYMQKQYKTLSAGGVVQNISSEIVYSTNLLKPSLPEQTKIADFLSAVDEKIHLVHGQIEKMEVWKKGLLQKMFV